jgi:PAS domain S-box-containing protein
LNWQTHVVRYAGAAGIFVTAALVRSAMQPLMPEQGVFTTFYLGIIAAAWYLGVGPAAVVSLSGALYVTYYLFPPINSWFVMYRGDRVWLLFYVIVSATVIAALELRRTAKQRAEAHAVIAAERLRQLEIEMAERQRAQLAEIEQRRWFETTLRSIGDAVIATDASARIVFLNEVAETLTGWSSAAALARPVSDVFDISNESTGAPVEIPVARVLSEGVAVGLANHTVLRSRTGRVIPIDDSAAPIRGTDGELLGVVLVFRDISDRKSAERAREQNLLDMERFAYIASHDLQEPLRTVSAFVTLLERHLGESLDPNAAEYMRFIVEAANKMHGLVHDLLQYSRVGAQAMSVSPISSEDVLAESLSGLAAKIESAGARITHDPLPRVYADRTKLVQVFQNLISNAIKFRGSDAPAVHISATRSDDRWIFSVRDNGIGFDQKYADRIFTMFQRLHPTDCYSGSGIGLSIARRIIENHEGSIWARSERGKGATFYFTLPQSHGLAAGA